MSESCLPVEPASRSDGLVVVALGSNLGDSAELIERAFGVLRKQASSDFRRSSVWRSAPVDCPPGSPDFLNAVCAWTAAGGDTADRLLDRLQEIERDFGRTPKRVLNEPRRLDLDIVLFGDAIRADPRLTLPHPRARLRRFVLGPLAELAPEARWPGTTSTVGELLARLGVEAGAASRIDASEAKRKSRGA
ncbi:MAG: 2-amino-4-hydroxy-6-hydroxymethyldihydropteridine diphosphokinase [Verrucomicrobiales bacterium]|nr:2-amino-4-hydroxy-6-hydroxymethyldihydropteridine diphosphokinase [Verrucomicrobiales bacterium]